MLIRRIALLLTLAAPVMVLSACAPTALPSPDATQSVGEAPAPTATTDPQNILDSADYRVEYQPADSESEVRELSHYAFWTDDSESVRCDVWIGGEFDPYAACHVTPEGESSVTYSLPEGITADCSDGADPALDGFETRLIAVGEGAGFELDRAIVAGCASGRLYPSVEVAEATRVLPNEAVLELEPFRCSVIEAVATCEYLEVEASISLGLTEIRVVNEEPR
jgi:hypothetical protein